MTTEEHLNRIDGQLTLRGGCSLSRPPAYLCPCALCVGHNAALESLSALREHLEEMTSAVAYCGLESLSALRADLEALASNCEAQDRALTEITRICGGEFEPGDTAANFDPQVAVQKVSALRSTIAEMGEQSELDRSAVADCLSAANRAIDGRHWLTEGRGPYEWNDDRWHSEFYAAATEIKSALEPLTKIAANWKDCSMKSEDVAKARIDLKAENAALRQQIAEMERKANAGSPAVPSAYPQSPGDDGDKRGTPEGMLESMCELAERECGHNPVQAKPALVTLAEWIGVAKAQIAALTTERDQARTMSRARSAMIEHASKRIGHLKAATKFQFEAFQAYVEWFGAVHSEGCPSDDTCAEGCDGFEINRTVEESFRAVDAALSSTETTCPLWAAGMGMSNNPGVHWNGSMGGLKCLAVETTPQPNTGSPGQVICWKCQADTRSDSDHCQKCGVNIMEPEEPGSPSAPPCSDGAEANRESDADPYTENDLTSMRRNPIATGADRSVRRFLATIDAIRMGVPLRLGHSALPSCDTNPEREASTGL